MNRELATLSRMLRLGYENGKVHRLPVIKRVVYLTPELTAGLAEQVARVDALQRRLQRIIPWLFPHLRGRCAGAPRHEFLKA